MLLILIHLVHLLVLGNGSFYRGVEAGHGNRFVEVIGNIVIKGLQRIIGLSGNEDYLR